MVARAASLGLAGLVAMGLVGLGASRLAGARPGAWRLGPAALAVLLGLLATACHGPRVRALLPREPGEAPPPARHLATLALAATALNLSFPGPAGEVAFALAVARRWGLRASAVLAASLHARLSGLLVGAGLVAALLPVVTVPPALWRPVLAGGLLVAAAGATLGGLSFRPRLLVALSAATAGRLGRLPGAAGRAFARLDDEVALFAGYLAAAARRGPAAWGRSLAWTAASVALLATATVAAAASVGVPLRPLGALFAMGVAQTTAMALVILPGGLGAFDASLVAALTAAAGVSTAEAGLAVLAVRACQLATLLAAALALAAWARVLLDEAVLARLARPGRDLDAPEPPGAAGGGRRG